MTEQNTPQEVDWQAERARLDQMFKESVQRTSRVQNAWSSREAEAVRKVVNEDGNVAFGDFVTHVGGILAACELVDKNGAADTERIIPLVDELFDKFHGAQEMQGGVTFKRKPGNRPYRHRTTPPVAFPGDGQTYQEPAPESRTTYAARR